MTLPPRLRDRPTADLIVLALTSVVVLCIAFLVFALIVSSIWFPDHDIKSLTQRIGTILSSLIGAIIGYLAGRGVTNGNHKGE